MAKVLLTGGTGLIGTQLSSLLKRKGYEVSILTRTPKKEDEYAWDVHNNYIDDKALDDIGYVIHLAGAGIADKKWTSERKQEIIDSRVKSAELLLRKVKALNTPLKAFISSSGIGYYGAVTTEKIFKENDPSYDDYISEVCQLWEKAAFVFKVEGIRTVALRTGVVLSKDGGALSKMKTPIISPIGSGKQYLPWIHIDDLCEMYLKAIEDAEMSGVFNAVAPEHHTSTSFSKTLAKNYKKPFILLGVPAFLLKLIFGELSVILLKGSRVSSEKIESKGFTFRFPTLQNALKNLF
ncbi:TIGR01777 family oxidoreductase [Flavobacteriaceae bacterium S356]|uniref:TIGR01777 family oxidoreductase n=1 Tax=Asprobacillus argus TaxID=3076534 RepID=A0ABU3LGK6_9FLAO|nr:TIGR01777 family oxidoreductase [Flavobacteriaceae bacterium S356]